MERLLVILPYVPFPLRRGTFQRVFHLTEQLAKAFAVDLFCLSHEREDSYSLPEFESRCERVVFSPFRHPPWPSFWTNRLWHPWPTTIRHWYCAGAMSQLGEFIRGRSYDGIYWFDLVMWPYIERYFGNHRNRIMDRSRVDWLFQTEELATLEDTAWGRFMRRENLWKIARYERRVMSSVSLEVVCGVEDKEFLDKRLEASEKVYVLPNGANVDFFNAEQWPPKPTAQPTALFCGALDYTPNTDGLKWYFEYIHQRILERCPQYSIILVGKSPTPEVAAYAELPGVDFQGEVPDVRPFYQKVWFQVVPLRIGGGTRLKISEGLAMGNPVVSTTLGAQGLDLEGGKDLLLADSAVDFAEACLRYVEEPGMRRKHAESGRRKIIDAYSWEALGQKLVHKIQTLGVMP